MVLMIFGALIVLACAVALLVMHLERDTKDGLTVLMVIGLILMLIGDKL